MFPAITLLISCSGSLGQHGGEHAKCASKCSLECRHRSPAISTFKSLSCPTWLSLISVNILNGSTFARILWHKDVDRNTLISSNQPLGRNFMDFVFLISSLLIIFLLIFKPAPSYTWKFERQRVAKRQVYSKLYEEQIEKSRERRMEDTHNYTRFIRSLSDKLKACVS